MRFKLKGELTTAEVVSRLGVCTVLATNQVEDDLTDAERAAARAEVAATLMGLRGADTASVLAGSLERCAQGGQPVAVVVGGGPMILWGEN